MAENVNAGPSAEEVFNKYFKKSQSVIGTLNPNIFWQLYGEANPPADNELSTEDSDAVEGEPK